MALLFQFALWHTQSLMTTPSHPYFLSLKRSNVLLRHLIWTANVEPKTGIGLSKNVVFNFWICPLILDNLRRLHPLSPEEAPRTSRWGVGELIAEIRMQTCNCLIYPYGLQRKRSTICIFTFVSSSLKDKMHFTCLTRSFTNARERIGNFTPLGRRKIEFYG